MARLLAKHWPGGGEDFSLDEEEAYLECSCGKRFAVYVNAVPDWSGAARWPWVRQANSDAGDAGVVLWAQHVAAAIEELVA